MRKKPQVAPALGARAVGFFRCDICKTCIVAADTSTVPFEVAQRLFFSARDVALFPRARAAAVLVLDEDVARTDLALDRGLRKGFELCIYIMGFGRGLPLALPGDGVVVVGEIPAFRMADFPVWREIKLELASKGGVPLGELKQGIIILHSACSALAFWPGTWRSLRGTP